MAPTSAAPRAALTSKALADGRLPLIKFLTNGLATAGVKDERQIGANATRFNVHDHRIFTFGVGNDVNAPLVDRLAASSGGHQPLRPPPARTSRTASVLSTKACAAPA